MGFLRSAVRHKLNWHTSFFWGLYRSAAEAMPHEHYMIKGSVDKNIEIEEDFAFRRSDFAENDAVDVWIPHAFGLQHPDGIHGAHGAAR